MKAHKRKTIAAAAVLALTMLTVSASPVLADSITGVENWNKYEPNNELVISGDKLGGTVIAGKMTANKPMVIWTENEVTEEEQGMIWESLKGNPGVGNPKEVVFVSGDGASAYGMTVDAESGSVKFDRTKNWSLLYTGEYRREAAAETEPGSDNNTEPGSDNNTEPGTEKEPDMQPEPEKGNEPNAQPEPEKGNEPDMQPGPEKGNEPDAQPEEGRELEELPEQKTDTLPELNVTGPEQEADTPPEPEALIDNFVPVEPLTPVQPEKETGDSSGNPSGNTTGNAFGNASGNTGHSYERIDVNDGPGIVRMSDASAVRVLDAQPETGPVSGSRDRQLDDTPRTGIPAEFTILLVISVVSVIALAVTLLAERRLRCKRKE